MKYNLGRVYIPDERDKKFPMSAALAKTGSTTRQYRYWWDSAWWGDQGATSRCVAYSWMHWVEDGPVTHFYKKRNFQKDCRCINKLWSNK